MQTIKIYIIRIGVCYITVIGLIYSVPEVFDFLTQNNITDDAAYLISGIIMAYGISWDIYDELYSKAFGCFLVNFILLIGWNLLLTPLKVISLVVLIYLVKHMGESTNHYGLLGLYVLMIAYTLSQNQMETVNAYMTTSRQEIIEDHCDELRDLNSSIYPSLSIKQRIEVLKEVMYCEEDYFGLRHSTIVFTSTLPENILGEYDYEEKVIAIDKSVIYGNSEHAVSIVLHEVYHHYQNCLVDHQPENLDIATQTLIKKYRDELNDYQRDHYEAYYNQRLEVDARKNEQNASVYIQTINTISR